MTNDAKSYDDLRQLMLLAWDNLLSTEDFGRLEQLLIRDTAARQFYLEESDLYGTICWNNVKSLIPAPLLEAKTASVGAESAVAVDIDRVLPSIQSTKTAGNVVLGFLARTNVILNRPVFWAILAVGTLFYGSFAIISWNLRSGELSSGETGNNVAVAMISSAVDVHWSSQISPIPDNSPVRSGEPLKIDSGTVRLELKRGVTLLVEGPAHWSVVDENRVALKSGKIVARVKPQAIGFTIDTPTAKVVDLGTEFGVETDATGATEVQVFTGTVELHPNVKHPDLSSVTQPITLVAGEGRRIEPDDKNGGVIVRNVVAMPNHLKQQATRTGARQIWVEGVYASSTHHLLNVYDLINGSGLKGDRHSAAWEHTMWHTAHERVKQEFVLFDLFRIRRLNSMKVWNFNDASNGRYAWIGVKQADIYVSTSGKGDPLSQPGDWTLVVADQQFAPGTGLPDYDTPTIVALNDVEGRFVAIVIEDAWGYGPHSTDPSPDVVGLSEVQFFESRLNAHKPDVKSREK